MEELIQTKGTPSVPSLSGSESFYPMAFMSDNTRGGVSTIGGENQFGNARQISIRSRSSISIPSRFVQPVTPVKTKRVSKRAADYLVKLFYADSTDENYGGKVERGSNVQTCVVLACSSLVSSHATKAETFEANRLYVRTTAKSGRTIIYLDPSILTEIMTDASVIFLLSIEFTVKFWSSLLPRTVMCDIVKIEELIDSLNGSSTRRGDFLTPKKKMKVDSGLFNLSLSFLVDAFKESTPFGTQPSFEEMNHNSFASGGSLGNRSRFVDDDNQYRHRKYNGGAGSVEGCSGW